MRLPLLASSLALLAAACGPGAEPPPPADDGILEMLQAVPGLSVVELDAERPGERAFALEYRLPVDHLDPKSPSFTEHATLIHRGLDVPLVVYSGATGEAPSLGADGVAAAIGGSQLALERRFTGASRPDLPRWEALTLTQAAADEHDLLVAVGAIYGGGRIGVGARDGGLVALEVLREHPDDLDGVITFGTGLLTEQHDPAVADRLASYADDCAVLHDYQRRLLRDREVFAVAFTDRATYRFVGAEVAYERAVVELELRYRQAGRPCKGLDPAAGDAAVLDLLARYSSPRQFSDKQLAVRGHALAYQDAAELGTFALSHAHLDDLLTAPAEDRTPYLPAAAEPPTYDPTVPFAIQEWLARTSPPVIRIDAEADPLAVLAPERGGTHVVIPGAEPSLAACPERDRAAIVTALEGWIR